MLPQLAGAQSDPDGSFISCFDAYRAAYDHAVMVVAGVHGRFIDRACRHETVARASPRIVVGSVRRQQRCRKTLFEDDRVEGAYASPPCFMHELDPVYGGIVPDPVTMRDVAMVRGRARKSNRGRSRRPRWSFAKRSLYWPFRGEPDLRRWMQGVCAAGLREALPVIVANRQPLVAV